MIDLINSQRDVIIHKGKNTKKAYSRDYSNFYRIKEKYREIIR